MNYDLNPFEGLCFLYYEMAHAGGHFDDNKNELVKESTKFWVDQVDGINLEDTLRKSFTQWFSSSNSEDRIHFLINGLLPNLKNTLNEDEREIVIMHVIGDMKYREIAEVIGTPIGTISWKYNEAIKKLKNKYESR